MGTGTSLGEAFAKAQASVGSKLPIKGKAFVSVHDKDKKTIIPAIQELVDLGFEISATRGTAKFLFENGIFSEVILKVHEGRPHVIDHLKNDKIDLVINTPLGKFSQYDDSMIRIESVRKKIPYTTTTSAAWAASQGIRYLKKDEVLVRPLPDDQFSKG
jgi:carbamoyl-phosphate synthase large subunit